METNDKMPFDFGESPNDKSKNIIKVMPYLYVEIEEWE